MSCYWTRSDVGILMIGTSLASYCRLFVVTLFGALLPFAFCASF
jgi:hypothetical protein